MIIQTNQYIRGDDPWAPTSGTVFDVQNGVAVMIAPDDRVQVQDTPMLFEALAFQIVEQDTITFSDNALVIPSSMVYQVLEGVASVLQPMINLNTYAAMTIPFFGNVSAATTVNVNSNGVYTVPANLAFGFDGRGVRYTHFCIYVDGIANEANQLITIQMVPDWNAPTVSLSPNGNDIVVTNTRNPATSSWVPIKDAYVGVNIPNMGVAMKGTNATVDLSVNSLSITFATMG